MLEHLIQFILHPDVVLQQITVSLGVWLYAIMFLVIFCETGLIITPFLPGDSLLFMLGAITALPDSPIQVAAMSGLMTLAAITGDATNYSIGRWFGAKIKASKSPLIRREHLEKTERFYLKHGGKTVVMARFIPIVRTFAPFVTGLAKMPIDRYLSFNILGAFLWAPTFIFAGYYFGNLPSVKSNFHLVIVAIIGFSVSPIAIEWIKSKRQLGRN